MSTSPLPSIENISASRQSLRAQAKNALENNDSAYSAGQAHFADVLDESQAGKLERGTRPEAGRQGGDGKALPPDGKTPAEAESDKTVARERTADASGADKTGAEAMADAETADDRDGAPADIKPDKKHDAADAADMAGMAGSPAAPGDDARLAAGVVMTGGEPGEGEAAEAAASAVLQAPGVGRNRIGDRAGDGQGEAPSWPAQAGGRGQGQGQGHKLGLADGPLHIRADALTQDPMPGKHGLEQPMTASQLVDRLMQAAMPQSATPDANVAGSAPLSMPSATAISAAGSLTPSAASGVNANAGAGLYQAVLSEAVGQTDWSHSMSKQVVWMANQHIRAAEMRLHPASLGTMDVQLKLDDHTVHVSFASQHGVVRDAIEQSLPRLRDMLAEQGLDLGQSSVSDQGLNQQAFAGQGSNQPGAGEHGMAMDWTKSSSSMADTENESIAPAPVIRRRAAVDYYI